MLSGLQSYLIVEFVEKVSSRIPYWHSLNCANRVMPQNAPHRILPLQLQRQNAMGLTNSPEATLGVFQPVEA
jgi:hypothetical protein